MPASWVYLSPHYDDVALSCGGLLWEQVQQGEHASVWTICAGKSPEDGLSPLAESLHERWQTGSNAPEQRRLEDRAACAVMNATPHYFEIPDCIYRTGADGRPLYDTENAIFGALQAVEAPLIERLSHEISASFPQGARLVSPLSLGGHVDHRLVRQVATEVASAAHLQLWFYADYPYILGHADQLPGLICPDWAVQPFAISPTGLSAWQGAIAAYASQISTFWPDLDAMRIAIRSYWEQNHGVVLWSTDLAGPH